MVKLGGWAALGLASTLVGCGGGGTSMPKAAAAVAPPLAIVPPRPPPAPVAAPEPKVTWALHPVEGAQLVASLDLGGGERVYVGESGDRWVAHDGAPGTAAKTLLPEPLAGVTHADGGGLWFVTVSGVVYPAREPLGPVDVPRRPPFGMHGVVAGKAAILGISESGRLSRTTYGGASWTEVIRDRVLEVAMGAGGEGLALLGPNDVRATFDDGASWQPIAAPLPRRVYAGNDGRAYVECAEDTRVLDRTTSSLAVSEPPKRWYSLPPAPDALPYVTMLRDGRATIAGPRFWGVARETDGAYLLARALGEPLVRTRAPELDGCKRVAIAASAAHVLVACDGRGDGEARGELRLLARDGEAPFHEVARVGSGAAAKRVWIDGEGTIVLSGACESAARPCTPKAATPIVRAAGASTWVTPVTKPPRRSKTSLRFDAVTFGAKGDRAYALATDLVDPAHTVSLLVSSDHGRTFAEKPIPEVPLSTGGRPLHPERVVSLTTDDDGAVLFAVVASDHGRTPRAVVYETKDDGASFDVRVTPMGDQVALDLAGRRGYAWDGRGRGWETADGAKSWAPETAPRGALPREVACTASGCLVGDGATRLGWLR